MASACPGNTPIARGPQSHPSPGEHGSVGPMWHFLTFVWRKVSERWSKEVAVLGGATAAQKRAESQVLAGIKVRTRSEARRPPFPQKMDPTESHPWEDLSRHGQMGKLSHLPGALPGVKVMECFGKLRLWLEEEVQVRGGQDRPC